MLAIRLDQVVGDHKATFAQLVASNLIYVNDDSDA